MKKQILLTALTLTLLASAVMTAAAEEVVATILFGPLPGVLLDRGGFAEYSIDTKDIMVADLTMRMFAFDKSRDLDNARVYNILYKYLIEGRQIIFENQGLKPFDTFESDRLLALIINGRRIELDQLLPRELVASKFPYADKSLKAQGR